MVATQGGNDTKIMRTYCTYCEKKIVRRIYPSRGIPKHPFCSADCRINCMKDERKNNRW